MNHVEGHFSGCVGLRIYWQAWLPSTQAPTRVLVISHGIGEHGGRYAKLAQFLVEQGFAVYAIDHRGHGQSQGRRAKIDRFGFTVDDLDQLVELAAGNDRHCPLFLLGHSMGGAIAVAYAVKHQQKLDGLVLSAAAVSLDGLPFWLTPICRLLAIVAPNLPLFPVDPSLVSRDPEVVRDYAQDPLNMHDKIPVRSLSELIKAAQWLPRVVSLLKLPLLVMHGTEDALVAAKTSEMIHQRATSSDKTLQLYPGLYHEILNELEPDRQRVMQDISDWLLARGK